MRSVLRRDGHLHSSWPARFHADTTDSGAYRAGISGPIFAMSNSVLSRRPADGQVGLALRRWCSFGPKNSWYWSLQMVAMIAILSGISTFNQIRRHVLRLQPNALRRPHGSRTLVSATHYGR